MKFRKIFDEIVGGYSKFHWEDKLFKLKHFDNSDLAELEFQEEIFSETAKKAGLPTEEEKIDQLKKDDLWDTKKFNEIKMLESFIKDLTDNKKNLLLDAQIASVNSQIKESEDKLKILLNEKYNLLGETVEKFVKRKVNEFYIYHSLFANGERFFNDESWGYLSDQNLNELIELYNITIERVTGNSLKRLAASSFFQGFYHLSKESIYEFFGIPIVKLTIYQSDLFTYGKYYSSMIDSHTPEDLLNDPDKLVEYYNKKKNINSNIKDSDEVGATSIVGGTTKDYEDAGIDRSRIVNARLRKMAEDKKGDLNSVDLMKVFAGK